MAVIKDVAKLAGVSVGTVSKYLNNPLSMKEETRRRVQEAAEKLQYSPSPLARSMRTGQTNTIAVIAPDIVNPFFAEVYSAIRRVSVNKGYTTVLYTTADDADTLKKYLDDISLHPIDGLILCFVEEDERIKRLVEKIQHQIPIVLFSWDINNTPFNCVGIDVFEGIFKSTNHLISLGHKNIAYVGGEKGNKISMQKKNGYLKALKDAGLETGGIYHGSFDLKTGYMAARELFMCPETPTALVAENDIIAIGCLKYLLQRGIRIPDDIAIIGFDNISISSMVEPALSTISLPIYKMSEEALNLLLSILNNAGDSKHKLVIMNTELIVRNSTDKTVPVHFLQ